MKTLIWMTLFVLLLPVTTQANDRYQQMQQWLKANEAEQRQTEADEAKSELQQLEKTRNCAIAKDRVARFERSSRLYTFDEKGERKFLSDEERSQAEKIAAGEIERWCN